MQAEQECEFPIECWLCFGSSVLVLGGLYNHVVLLCTCCREILQFPCRKVQQFVELFGVLNWEVEICAGS